MQIMKLWIENQALSEVLSDKYHLKSTKHNSDLILFIWLVWNYISKHNTTKIQKRIKNFTVLQLITASNREK